ncbi:DUF4097 family beta strand repeat-containing protein [Fulvivirgaceae bacterium BMA10]|uniref:DUF4097 family beta strand repeat-containing protein n=2 Tax=Splendidivirga corallicola TaxID=3051826 RepID=A0ABT8KME6_9BACT|nr:DUF4097 family beta strand repeat-containing protein [Fulvivirgaceae bacterium BMA10]
MLKIGNGSLSIKGTDRKDVLIKYMAKETVAKDADGGVPGLSIKEKSNFLFIDYDSARAGIDLNIEVPLECDMELRTFNHGDIRITNVNGFIKAQNSKGDITAKKISGAISTKTNDGQIEVELLKAVPNTQMAFISGGQDMDVTLPKDIQANLFVKNKGGKLYTNYKLEVTNTKPSYKFERIDAGEFQITKEDWMSSPINGGGPEVVIRNSNGDIYLRSK